MYFLIILALVICQLFSRVTITFAFNDQQENDICPFKDTVNLTDAKRYDNGSYLYEGILIPMEKQRFYDYELKFLAKKHSVPVHRRGCVCEKKPCTKLCCKRDKYLIGSRNASSCEEITPKINVSWKLPIQLKDGQIKEVDIFEHFTIQVGLPCQNPKPLNASEDEWILNEDGILVIPSDDSDIDTLNYCYSFVDNSTKYILTPFSCPMQNDVTWDVLLNTYAMTVSVLFLIPTIVVYLILKELRGNLRGKLLISYLFSLTIAYSVISLINATGIRFGYTWCNILGYSSYFFFVAAYLWLSILCYDIWMTFRESNVESNSKKHHKRFIMYSLYAWLIAGIETGILAYLQLSPNVDDYYKPEIGVEICWINTSKWSAAYYFYGPNLIIVLFNMITFIYLTRKIYRVRSDLAKMTHKDKFIRENIIVILRLFLIMGISWFFDILSFCLQNNHNWKFVFVISDFANAIQGLLIFSLFILKPKILNRLRYIFRKNPSGKTRTNHSTCTTTFSKLPSLPSKLVYLLIK